MDGLVNLQELREQLERECNERQREVAAQLAWTPEREKRTHEEALRLLATWREEHVADDTIDIEVNSVTTDKDVADVQNTTGTNSDSNVQPSTAQNKAVPASSTEGRRLYIGNVAYATTKGDLKGFFKDYLVYVIETNSKISDVWLIIRAVMPSRSLSIRAPIGPSDTPSLTCSLHPRLRVL